MMNDDELLRSAQEADEASEQVFSRRIRDLKDFRYDEQQEKYWDTTTATLLASKSVDGAIPRELWPTKPDGRSGKPIPYKPSIAINSVETGLTVEGSTWWPGKPPFIENMIVNERGAIPKEGAVCYNTYVPPERKGLRNDRLPDQWIDHVKMLFPDELEHEHFFNFAAHMLQRPDQKVNHGIVMAGTYGIGKDTALLPLRHGVGNHNTTEIEPDTINRSYNGYVKSVMLVINEVRPHDEDHKASNFYNQLKPLLASPPEMLSMEIKYANPISVRNLCHVVLTTNDPLTMYIPEGDRRLFVMTSPLPDPKFSDVFPDGYFERLHEYLDDGGIDAVVRWLLARDISDWRPAEPPPMTDGKRAIINSSQQVRRTMADDLMDVYIEHFGGKHPEVIFQRDLIDFINAGPFFEDKLSITKAISAKNFHFKMDERGYEMVKNPNAAEWRNGKFRSRTAFVSKAIGKANQIGAAEAALVKRPLTFDFEEF